MVFYFKGNIREQLFFTSPNICAAFLGMLSILSIAAFIFILYSPPKNKYLKYGLMFFMGVFIVYTQYLLCSTYSRGGLYGYLAALGLLFILLRKLIIIIPGVSLGVILFFLNGGVGRIASVGDIAEGSIWNRLLLWRGALCIIYDNWLDGVGIPGAVMLYKAWHQPLWLNAAYGNMINDYLSLACGYGLLLSGLIVFIILAILWCSMRIQFSKRNAIISGIICAAVCYMANAMFSSMMITVSVTVIFILLLIVLLIYNIAIIKNVKYSFSDIIIPFAFALLLSILVYCGGMYYTHKLPYLITAHTIMSSETQYHFSSGVPKQKRQPETVLFAYDAGYGSSNAAREYIRPLLDRGYKVYFWEADSGTHGLVKTMAVLDAVAAERAVLLCVENAGKQLFIAHAKKTQSNVQNIILYNVPLQWPIKSLSCEEYIMQVKTRLWLATEKDICEISDWQKICQKYDLPLHILSIRNHKEIFDFSVL